LDRSQIYATTASMENGVRPAIQPAAEATIKDRA
jgi:hypothetical protein